MRIVTTNGTLVHGHVPNTKNEQWTHERATAWADAANARAEALGIKTRYVVDPPRDPGKAHR